MVLVCAVEPFCERQPDSSKWLDVWEIWKYHQPLISDTGKGRTKGDVECEWSNRALKDSDGEDESSDDSSSDESSSDGSDEDNDDDKNNDNKDSKDSNGNNNDSNDNNSNSGGGGDAGGDGDDNNDGDSSGSSDDDEDDDEEDDDDDDNNDDTEKEKPKEEPVVPVEPPKKRKTPASPSPTKVPAQRKPRKKKKKGPKSTVSSYMYFCKTVRPEFKAQNPQLDFAGLAKLCGQKWKELPPEQKQPFIDMQQADKNRYLAEKAELKAAGELSSDEEVVEKKTKKKKGAGAPKNATSAYMYFCKARRPQIAKERPDLGFPDFGKILGAEWKELDQEAKKTYYEQSQKDRDRYNIEIAEFKEKQKEEAAAAVPEVKPEKTKLKGKLTDKDVTAYVQELREQARARCMSATITAPEIFALLNIFIDSSQFEVIRKVVNYKHKPS